MIDRFWLRLFLNRLLKGRLLSLYGMIGHKKTDYIYGVPTTYETNSDIGKVLFFQGTFEKNELTLCEPYLTNKSIILDIGANIGLHSIYFSEIAKDGLVISFEPSLTTFDLLVRNVESKPNILPVNMAISDVGGIFDFFQTTDNAYSSLIDTKRKEIINLKKVLCLKIDDFINAVQLPRVDFVKIDVEGLEHHVLCGMEQLILKYRPVIFCEIYQGVASNPSPDDSVKFLLERDYKAYVMLQGRFVQYEKHNDSYYNYLFLPKDKIV